jgi:hypothetical protein
LRAFAFALLLLPGLAAAAVAHVAPEIRAQVVDEESSAPLAGVVIVARWEWLEYRPTFHGSPYRNEGDALHMVEVVTGSDGRFVIPGWGPKGRETGRLDDHEDPKLSLFKSGYAPLELRNERWTSLMQPNPALSRGSDWHGKTLKLRKSTASPKEYAQQIRRFQGELYGALWWRHQGDHWKSMPRMILALHREKRRLGEDGRAVLGANALYGRSGRGELRDAQTNEVVQRAVIQVTWMLRREGGTATRRFVEQRRSGVEGDSAQFYLSPWRLPGPRAPGWEVAYDTPPLVRIYAQGYGKSPDRRWDGNGGTIRLQKLADTKEALLAELRAWRRDAEAELAGSADRAEALAGQQHLLWRLSDQCRTLTADVRAGICLAADSEVERYVEQVRRSGSFTMEMPDESRQVRIVAAPGGVQAAAPARAVGGPVSGRIEPVSGFSIEPAK